MGMLVAMAAARQLAKPVYLVNTSIFAVEGFDDVLMDLQDLNVRESESSDFLQKRGIPHRLVLDSFLGARFVEEPYQNLDGKTVVMDWHPNRDKDVGRAIIQYYESLPENESHFLPLNHQSHVNTWRHTVANLATADLIITGRYHGVYLAGLAGIPFVGLPSNTAKIEGLIRSSGLPLPLCENSSDIASAANSAKRNPALFTEFKAFLLDQLPLSTFDPLVSLLGGQVDPAANERRVALEVIEARIETARVEAQHNIFYSQTKKRVELTPCKQLQHLGSIAVSKLRETVGI